HGAAVSVARGALAQSGAAIAVTAFAIAAPARDAHDRHPLRAAAAFACSERDGRLVPQRRYAAEVFGARGRDDRTAAHPTRAERRRGAACGVAATAGTARTAFT